MRTETQRRSEKQYYERNRTKIAERHRKYWAENKVKLHSAQAAWREQNKEKLAAQLAVVRRFRDWLKSQPCKDCGGWFPPVCMDFDHRSPSEKSITPAFLFSGRVRLETIQTELMKCDVVCGNCHRLRSAKMFNWPSAR